MKTTVIRPLSRALLGGAALLGLTMLGDDCSGDDIVKDPTFRDWCGSSLCAWKTDYGAVARVPTWNANDFGVSFLDNGAVGTEISQATEEYQATCILFTSVGDIDPKADMTVSVDFNNDGTIESVQQLGAASWAKVQTEVTAPAAYEGITFYVKKSGTGAAVLAEMTITSTTGCTAAPPPVAPLKLGEACTSTSQCQTGLVCPEPMDGSFRVCGQCSADVPCSADGGVACAQRSVFLPFQCGPGQGLGLSGAPCLANDDCASGACDGATPVGLVSTDAAPCDLNTLGPDSGASCTWDLALGGTCR